MSGPVDLVIDQPQHDHVVARGQPVSFVARPVAAAPLPTLYVRWYSSLPAAPGLPPDPGTPPNLNLVALNPTSTWSFARTLWVGSHAVTVAAKDVKDDDAASLARVKVAGLAGGAPPPPGVPQSVAPCMVHALVAQSIVPPHPTASPPPRVPMSRAAGVWAEAPCLWGEDSYQRVNGLVYTWTFQPSTGPAVALTVSGLGRVGESASFAPASATSWPARLGIKPLPASVPNGPHQLTLTVSHSSKPGADSVSLPVDVGN